MNISKMNEEKYITIKELADLKGVSTRAVRLLKGKYVTRKITVKGGRSFEILLSSIEPKLQEKYLKNIIPTENKKLLPVPIEFQKPEKAKVIALARYELLKNWQEQRKMQKSKTKFDADFISTYNSGFLYPDIYSKIGKVSIGTLERWKRILDNSTNYELLIPKFHYTEDSRTNLTDYEKQIFLKLLLHPNKFSIGKAISLTQYVLKTQNAEYIPSAGTFRRFANTYRNNNFDTWTLMREGEKALKEQIIPHIIRDTSKIEVGEILVADGKRLNFQVINPFTGKPVRATIVGFLDWKSTALVGYEIMIEENTQCIASALRNAILNLGKVPKFVYLDNGKAFRGKYFSGSLSQDIGYCGIYENLGITPIYASPYNPRSKVIERFWKAMQESFEKLIPSYIGTNIENKPARLKRNENFHSELHQNIVPTIPQTVQMIDSWLKYKNSLPCSNYKTKTVFEMLATVEKQEINEQLLDDLMLAAEVKTISSQGIRFLNSFYFNDVLYGLRQKVVIKYSLFDLSSIKVYTTSGKFLCKAEKITPTHPLAYYTGDIKDIEDYKQKIVKQKQLKNKTIKECKKLLNIEDLDIIKCNLIEENTQDEISAIKIAEIKNTKPKKEKYNPAVKPLFKTNFERYEYLMNHGCISSEDRVWLENYKESKEFKADCWQRAEALACSFNASNQERKR